MSSEQPTMAIDLSPMVIIDRRRLRRLRQESGMSQIQLADRCGLSFGYVGHLERGTRLRVSPRVLGLLCDALGVKDRAELMAS